MQSGYGLGSLIGLPVGVVLPSAVNNLQNKPKSLLAYLAEPMHKKANRASSLIRAGKLGVDSLKRLGISPSLKGEKLDEALKFQRHVNSLTPNGELLPAHLAYSAGDSSAAGRLAGLFGKSPMTYSNLSPRIALPPSHAKSYSLAPWESRVPRPTRVEEPMGFIKSPDVAWGSRASKTSGVGRRYFFRPSKNELSIDALGTPTSRHELGHWLQHRFAESNPSRLNIPTHSAFRRLLKADRHLAAQVAGNRTAAVEFQGHLLASKGHGAGARRLRDATATNPELGNIHNTSSKLRQHPATANHPEVISTAEHLMRNYGISPALGKPGYNPEFHLFASGRIKGYDKF
jgi:hypothetical protein